MFTGIITDVGTVQSVTKTADVDYVIRTTYPVAEIAIGASIACDGACLTVVERDADWFKVSVSQETLSKTTLGRWGPGTRVNLERALKVGDELGGHMVLGHVDGLAELISVTPENGSHRLVLEAPADLARFIAAKGSVCLDGVSLTVNEVDGRRFGVNIIPHTWEVTGLGDRAPGDFVNLEIDVLARYVQRLHEML
ncbi:MAG: riboflavin synthase [Alphaproteobacteria bacterium]|nr:riboflavin synthase [Alphaproteobacteria bacterium]